MVHGMIYSTAHSVQPYAHIGVAPSHTGTSLLRTAGLVPSRAFVQTDLTVIDPDHVKD